MQLPNILKNIAAGTTSQFGIYLANLATLPYLARVLGTDGLGQVVYIQSVMALIMLFVDFGFSWSAIKVISTSRRDKPTVSRYFFSTWAAQWILTILCGAILIVTSMATDFIQANNRQLFFGYLIVIGYTLFPFWLLNGLEKFNASSSIQLISKIATIPILFLIVKSHHDIEMAILFFATCNLLGGFLFIIYILKSNTLEWRTPSLSEIIHTYKSSLHTFLARINVSLCSLLIPIYLNFISGPAEVGLYTLADKVKNLILSLTGPIAAALFPRMSFLAQTENQKFIKLGIKAFLWQISMLIPICFLTWYFAVDIAMLIGGNQFINASTTIRWLSVLPLLTATANILGMQIMLPIGMEKTFAKINFLGLIAVTALGYKYIPTLHADGAAITLVLTEIFIITMMTYKLRMIKI